MTEEEKKRYIRTRNAGLFPWEQGYKEEQNPVSRGHERKSDPIRIKIDSHDIKRASTGQDGQREGCQGE